MILFICYNNKGEYSSDEYTNYVKKLGAKAEYTAPYTSEQNDKAKCLNYSLVSIIWAVMFDKKLSKSL